MNQTNPFGEDGQDLPNEPAPDMKQQVYLLLTKIDHYIIENGDAEQRILLYIVRALDRIFFNIAPIVNEKLGKETFEDLKKQKDVLTMGIVEQNTKWKEEKDCGYFSSDKQKVRFYSDEVINNFREYDSMLREAVRKVWA